MFIIHGVKISGFDGFLYRNSGCGLSLAWPEPGKVDDLARPGPGAYRTSDRWGGGLFWGAKFFLKIEVLGEIISWRKFFPIKSSHMRKVFSKVASLLKIFGKKYGIEKIFPQNRHFWLNFNAFL